VTEPLPNDGCGLAEATHDSLVGNRCDPDHWRLEKKAYVCAAMPWSPAVARDGAEMLTSSRHVTVVQTVQGLTDGSLVTRPAEVRGRTAHGCGTRRDHR